MSFFERAWITLGKRFKSPPCVGISFYPRYLCFRYLQQLVRVQSTRNKELEDELEHFKGPSGLSPHANRNGDHDPLGPASGLMTLPEGSSSGHIDFPSHLIDFANFGANGEEFIHLSRYGNQFNGGPFVKEENPDPLFPHPGQERGGNGVQQDGSPDAHGSAGSNISDDLDDQDHDEDEEEERGRNKIRGKTRFVNHTRSPEYSNGPGETRLSEVEMDERS